MSVPTASFCPILSPRGHQLTRERHGDCGHGCPVPVKTSTGIFRLPGLLTTKGRYRPDVNNAVNTDYFFLMLDVFHAVSRRQSQPRTMKWGEENHEGDPLTSPDCVSRYGKSPSPARGGSHRPSGPEPTLQSRRCVCSQHQTSKTKRRRAKTFPFIFRRRDSCTDNKAAAIGCLYDARSTRWPHGSEEMALEFSKMFFF